MAREKRSGKNRLFLAAPLESQSEREDYITTLYPEGSANSVQHDIERRHQLVRPEISWLIVALNVFAPIAICFALFWWDIRIALICMSAYFLVRLRGILIFFIRVYQRYAPEDMRVACTFEPSCSEYMRLALLKYGVIKGTIKGVNRLMRCQPPGGIDYP